MAQGNWLFVRRRAEYPGNHPDYDTLRKVGITGILTEIDDPFLPLGLAQDPQAGFAAGVWLDPGKYGAPADAVNHTNVNLGGQRPDLIALDPETGNVAKGSPGSAQWNYSEALAAAFQAAYRDVPIVVTPTPLQDDFNYGAYFLRGQNVWVQTYGSDVAQLFDPVQVVRRVEANHVPMNRIGALISPLQLPTAPAALRAIGVASISVYTSDHWSPEVTANTSPFPPVQPPKPPKRRKRRKRRNPPWRRILSRFRRV